MSFQFSRRDFGRIGVGSLITLLFTQYGCEASAAELPAASGKCQGSITQLPDKLAANLVEKVLLSDPRFQTFYQYFSKQGMRFIPERAQVLMYVEKPASENAAVSSPAILAIVPSFREFKASDRAHEAVSIVGVYHGDRVGGVYAAHVNVQHNPFKVAAFSMLEIDAEKEQIVWQRVDRDTLSEISERELAAKFRPPIPPQPRDRKQVRAFPSLSERDAINLTADVYRTILSDSYARPLYPFAGYRSLLNDTQLIQRWSLVQRERYSSLVSQLALGSCSTSSSSCNGCTCTSTSFSLDAVINPADILANPVEIIDVGRELSNPVSR
jgi:hypothetical protein